ncbi:hypothetical protein A5707_10025 [Mycobacterium kyorinense]|uniref:Uncharacterized protein n=1 Tax=Mycobacterium kyorinense TaxID=487514 RepID=A0A1A2YQG8_9MYCO|nr:hypothetical protein [Mycobacterium kyorinense]OBI40250.1 hypothetical protein A5707_10025 [Mycobacterium kyorinense]
MTSTSQKAEPRWAELSDDVLESIETGRKNAIDAVRKFIDEVTSAVEDQSRRKTVVEASLDLAEELATDQIEFFRSVVRSVGQALSKE